MYLDKIKSYLSEGLSVDNPFIMICDCETTGYSEKLHDLISFSGKIVDYNLETKSEITVYAKPNKERWTWQAEKVHGFKLEEALTFPEPRKTAIELLHFLKPFKSEENNPILFVSHDTSGFDYRFFKSFFINALLVDSFEKVFDDGYRLSTISMGRKVGHKKNGLKEWAERLELDLNHHEAESDRDACFEVFKNILDNTGVQNELEIQK